MHLPKAGAKGKASNGAVDLGGQVNEAFGSGNAVKCTDAVERFIQRGGGFGGQLQDQIKAARAGMNSFNLWHRAQAAEQGGDGARADLQKHSGANAGGDGVIAETQRVAHNHTITFKFFQPNLHDTTNQIKTTHKITNQNTDITNKNL